MPELDDKTTDRLFQTGAGRHDFSYDPAAWAQMEELLDKAAAHRRRRLLLLLAGLVLVLSGGYAYYRSLAATAPLTTGQVIHDGPVAVTAPAPTERTAIPALSRVAGEAGVKGEEKTSRRQKEPAPAGGVSPGGSAGPPSGGYPDGKAENRQRTPPRGAGYPPGEQPPGLPARPGNASSVSAGAGQLAIGALPRRHASLAVPMVELPEVEIIPGGTGRIRKSGLRAGLAATVSAGFSSGLVQPGEPGPAGGRFGARLEYRLSDKFSLGAGAYHAKVAYRVAGEAYKADAGFWVYDIVPAEVMADCDILELPLSLAWYPRGASHSGVYLSGGLTSYLMLTEKFAFEYDVTSDELIKSWREDNTNRHLAGAGQFSVGYQRKAGRRSAFQVESFVQLPLTGIGQGQVSLLTVGASVNYTFDFRKRR